MGNLSRKVRGGYSLSTFNAEKITYNLQLIFPWEEEEKKGRGVLAPHERKKTERPGRRKGKRGPLRRGRWGRGSPLGEGKREKGTKPSFFGKRGGRRKKAEEFVLWGRRSGQEGKERRSGSGDAGRRQLEEKKKGGAVGYIVLEGGKGCCLGPERKRESAVGN